MPLMTVEEYLNKYKTFPYLFTIEKDDKRLFYFGEKHVYDPADVQWIELKKFWNEFLSATGGKKRIALVEGGVPENANETVMISKRSGTGLVTFLANRESIKVISPEPDELYERSELEKEFSRDEIQYYYFARYAYQWHKLLPGVRPSFEKYISDCMSMDKRASGWPDYDFSFRHMKEVHQELLGESFEDGDTVESWKNIVHPYLPNTVINNVSLRSGQIRDEYIVQQIMKYMNEGYSIFVNYGGSHAVAQEPYLRELMT